LDFHVCGSLVSAALRFEYKVLTRFRGERSVGNWTVIVKDTNVNDNTGVFTDWRLNIWGECIDASTQMLHPLPEEHDDDHVFEDAPVQTTSIERPTQTSELPANPTDHIDRPVNAKPTTTEPSSTSSTPTSSPAPSPDSFLPSYFPTFGVSRKSQIWIYGAASLILVFGISLATYAFIQRRKRLRNNPRDEYEFEMLADGEGEDGANGHANGVAGKKGKTRRAGELYDAFAGESDEEFSDDAVFSDSEREGPYTDRPERGRNRQAAEGRTEGS
jgi:kexin